MRGLLLSAALLLVAGCNGQETPSASGASGVEPAAEVQDRLSLSGAGLAVGETKLAFGTARDEADALVSKALGETAGSSENDECGAGPMAFSHYPGGLTLNYQDGKLVGWLHDQADAKVKLENGLAIGWPQAEAEALAGFTRIEDSTLGEEFYLEPGGVGGFFEQGKVTSLYGGINCFFR